MNKLIATTVLMAATTFGGVSAQANDMGVLQLARIAQKSGTVTSEQKDLLIRYGHWNGSATDTNGTHKNTKK